MSVAAMTMDDQRPLNSFETMNKQYDSITNAGVGSDAANGGAGGGSVETSHNPFAAPPSGPASPTPSTSDDQQTSLQQHQQHHHHASAHQHHHHHHHQQQQQHHHHQQQSQQQPYEGTESAATTAAAVAEQRRRQLEEEVHTLKIEQARLQQQCAESLRREKILMRRLANKEQEFQEYVSQIAEYKAAQVPSVASLRSALLDPAVNLLFEKLKKELKATKAKLEETQNELSAWKFTPDSNTGKRLMAKCRLLYQENEELGKMTSNGRLAKLETELAMQKSFSEEVKKSQSELDDFLQELDEDVEGMQSTILFLQQELKTTRDRIQALEKENAELKNGSSNENTVDALETGDSGEVDSTDLPNSNGSNNGIVNTTAKIINNIIYNQMPNNAPLKKELHDESAAYNSNANAAHALTNAVIANKTQTLETIEENVCLQTPNPLPAINENVVLNGAAPQMLNNANPLTAVNAGSITGDDGSNSNSNSNSNSSNIVSTTRSSTTATVPRKRPYDCTLEATEHAVVTPPQVQVSAWTLPPKKSKLRTTIELNDDNGVNLNTSSNTNNLSQNATPMLVTTTNAFVENNCATLANSEETTGGALVIAQEEESVNAEVGVAQRIMTRRRSARNQPNSDSNNY